MIHITQIKLPLNHTKEDLKKKISKLLRLSGQPFQYQIVRQSLDARHKDEKMFVYTVDVKIDGEKKLIKKVGNANITLIDAKPYRFPTGGSVPLKNRPVIIGSGPAGIFCAWYLARAGFAPVVYERGEEADKRKETVDQFWKNGVLDPDSNVQFGEGGAGTFSDGKLNTLVKDPVGRNHEVLKRFVQAGANEEILYQQKPHLGTDVLIHIVQHLRHEIEEMGGEFHFRSKLTGLYYEGDQLTGVQINGETRIDTEVCVLAIGHSARDTFFMLHEHALQMEPKAFAVGVRIEHPQKMINMDLYGEEENEYLGAGAYKVTHTASNGRGVYSFCMCPGGYVVNASTEKEQLAINGMSYQARDGVNANSALIVTVDPADFPEDGPLGGIAFQRGIERAAYQAGQGKVPVQIFQDFRENRPSTALGEILPQIKGEYTLANVRAILPDEIGNSIEEGVLAFGAKMPGFDRPDAVLSGVESRTSSPVRIVRDGELEGSIRGIYPCGEGAGYAGGITSAAMDGIRVAEAISKKFVKF
ncbi:MAG: NAD(P)-binding protein [Clostridiales bacterium]|nr:NAD(P)-binding protein [Candidatus Blautia equi]